MMRRERERPPQRTGSCICQPRTGPLSYLHVHATGGANASKHIYLTPHPLLSFSLHIHPLYHPFPTQSMPPPQQEDDEEKFIDLFHGQYSVSILWKIFARYLYRSQPIRMNNVCHTTREVVRNLPFCSDLS